MQPVSSCKLKGSLRIQVEIAEDEERTWLKVFTSTLEQMLEHVSSVTLQSAEEEVYTQLLLLEDFFVDFNEQTSILEDVRF